MTVPPHETALLTRAPPRAAVLAGPSPRHIAISVAIIIALLLPLFMTSFITFQLTLVMIYGLAILGLNLLTGFNGQFSLGHSAFYGIGAYTAAILMDQADLAYYWTLPCAGALCFVVGISIRITGIAAARPLFSACHFCAGDRNAADPEISPARAADRGCPRDLPVLKPDPPPGVSA